MVKDASEESVFTTFIGIGLDFDTKLVEKLTKFKGCNYFAANTKKEFKKIMNIDFNYIVSPIVMDSDLIIESDCFEIDVAYGTPFKDETTKKLYQIRNTMCIGYR